MNEETKNYILTHFHCQPDGKVIGETEEQRKCIKS